MEKNFFDTKSDFNKYIDDRLMEISDEDDRRALKEIVKDTLIPLYLHTEEAYLGLERRLLESKEEKWQFEILIGIANRNEVNLAEKSFFPMQDSDIHKTVVHIDELMKHLKKEQSYTIMCVFVQMNNTAIKQIEKEKRVYKGVICTETEEYPAFFKLNRNYTYLKQIADLYPIFQANGHEWNTVCAPYLFKYFDVDLIKTECPYDAEINEIRVDFEEYQEYVKYDLIPMWNVRMIEEASGAYPAISIDRMHYEHCIYKERLKENRDYLVGANNRKIWNTVRMKGDLHIFCDSDKPLKWELLEFTYEAKQKKYNSPIFGNSSNGNSNRKIIHTYGEVRRYIKELGYEKYLELTEILPKKEYAEEDRHTYSMDWFMEDEIRNAEFRPYIVFQFVPVERENYLNEDIMSYLVSKIQWQLPEYVCLGELV